MLLLDRCDREMDILTRGLDAVKRMDPIDRALLTEALFIHNN